MRYSIPTPFTKSFISFVYSQKGENMKSIILLLIVVLFFPVYAQEVKVTARSGDADIDLHLDEVNKYGRAEFEFFKKDMSLKFGVAAGDIHSYYYKEKVSPGDIYYAFTLSAVSGRPVRNIFDLYKKKKGWGAIAQELGIKPGSREFHMLKGRTLSGIGKVKSKHVDTKKGGTPKSTPKGKRK